MMNANTKKPEKKEEKDEQLEMITSALVTAFCIAAVLKAIYFIYTTFYAPQSVEDEL